jgi:sulfur-oxidizing protein SoxX
MKAAVLARAAGLAALLLATVPPVAAQDVVSPVVEAGAIAAPLGGKAGDAARGRLLVVDRRKGLCLLCHSGPFPEERFQGTIAPSLAGAGSRLTEGQLRLRITDSTRINSTSLMPAYHRTEGLVQVGQTWRGKPIFTAGEVEDVVAFLKTLQD